MTSKSIHLDEDDFRILHHLLTRWKMLHARYRVCCKRINWYNRKASELEKKRRKEKWEIVASVLQIENEILKMLATITKDPSIYTTKSHPSQLAELRRAYARNRRRSHNVVGTPQATAAKLRRILRKKRMAIVAQIRAIIRSWMERLHVQIFGSAVLPTRLPLHDAELIPRKLKRAYVTLRKELAA
jgi:dsDNA-specific endonuclease/ATPase MutS2